VTLLSSTDTAYDDYVVLRINSVNDAVVAELVLPIARQRRAQRQSVSFGGNGWLLLQDFPQLISHTAVEGLYIRCGIRGVSKLKGRFGTHLFRWWCSGRGLSSPFGHLPKTSAVVRSEERRVGKECRSGWGREHLIEREEKVE